LLFYFTYVLSVIYKIKLTSLSFSFNVMQADDPTSQSTICDQNLFAIIEQLLEILTWTCTHTFL